LLVPVRANHRFDTAVLARYLAGELPGFDGEVTISQFQGGQSNPTFHIATPAGAYVLRKKPPGALLQSAHAVDREYAVLRALAATEVPVPRVHLLCRDEDVIGQMFYVMDYVPGRVFADRRVPGADAATRAAMHDEMNRVLAALHQVDWRAIGLETFGRPDGYMARQVRRWSAQYQSSRTAEVPAMEAVAGWLAENAPPAEEVGLVHGDYRLGNLLFDPVEPRVVAVLDWELATIGHPLADLAYNLLTYRLPASAGGIPPDDVLALGMPSEDAYVAEYCRRTDRSSAPGLEFMIVFAMYRLAAILAGVYRRALDGNAADAEGLERGRIFRDVAEAAWHIANSTKG
jgi:aminoglycoside phosphotransferase (APT) family kinase protein